MGGFKQEMDGEKKKKKSYRNIFTARLPQVRNSVFTTAFLLVSDNMKQACTMFSSLLS